MILKEDAFEVGAPRLWSVKPDEPGPVSLVSTGKAGSEDQERRVNSRFDA